MYAYQLMTKIPGGLGSGGGAMSAVYHVCAVFCLSFCELVILISSYRNAFTAIKLLSTNNT